MGKGVRDKKLLQYPLSTKTQRSIKLRACYANAGLVMQMQALRQLKSLPLLFKSDGPLSTRFANNSNAIPIPTNSWTFLGRNHSHFSTKQSQKVNK